MSDDLKVGYFRLIDGEWRSGYVAYVATTPEGARGTDKHTDEPVELRWNSWNRRWEEIS